MDEQVKMERIIKHVEEFDTYSERAQGMLLMLAMCLKAGFPMPFPEAEEKETEATNNPNKKKGA